MAVEAESFKQSCVLEIEHMVFEKEVALATSLCYYLSHEDNCKSETNTIGS